MSDNPFILSILNYVPKPSLKEFIKALSPERRSQLYEIVMPQKNGDRVMKAFISEMGIMPQLEEHTLLKTINRFNNIIRIKLTINNRF